MALFEESLQRFNRERTAAESWDTIAGIRQRNAAMTVLHLISSLPIVMMA